MDHGGASMSPLRLIKKCDANLDVDAPPTRPSRKLSMKHGGASMSPFRLQVIEKGNACLDIDAPPTRPCRKLSMKHGGAAKSPLRAIEEAILVIGPVEQGD